MKEDYKTPTQVLVHSIIMNAIEKEIPCIVSLEENGTSLESYQDRIGIYQILALYTSNYTDIDGVTGLRLMNEKTKEEQGSLFINWKKASRISINSSYSGLPNERYLIQIGNLKINFLK